MSGAAPALIAGLVAGYGLAMPMGAISVLIVNEGLARGWRSASAAATGVSLVDLGYVCLALAAGAAVTDRLRPYTRTVQLVGAAVLLVVVAHGLNGLRRRPAAAAGMPDGAGPPPAPGQGAGAGRAGVLRRFVGLTLVNPWTAVYFVVLTAGLGDAVRGVTAATAFAAGVVAASWSWALLLAGAGTLAGARMPPWARGATSVAGYLVVLGYAVRLAVG